MMRRIASLIVLIAAVAPPVAAGTPSPVWPAVREALEHTEDASTASFHEPSEAPRVLAAGDLDRDGAADAILATPLPQPGNASEIVRVKAVSARTGATLWTHSFTRVLTTPGETAWMRGTGVVWVRSGPFLDDDAIRDVVVAQTDPVANQTSLTAIAGDGGAILWRRPSTGTGGSLSAGATLLGPSEEVPLAAGLTVPLGHRGDLDGDGADELLAGTYYGTRTSSGTAWLMDLALVSGATGATVHTWRVTSLGLAPTAAFATLTRFGGEDVVIAAATARALETTATVWVFDDASRGVFFGQWPGTSFDVTAPARPDDLALSLRPLYGAAYGQDGLLVGFDTGPQNRSGNERLRGSVAGPATLVSVMRGAIESMRVTLPSGAAVQLLGDVNRDGVADVRTVRVDHDSLVVETWSGSGTGVPLLPPRQMTFLEGDDYRKAVDVRVETRDADGDRVAELLIGGGYPCGPRYQMIDGASGSTLWGRPEIRAIGCFGRLLPAGASLGGAAEDVIEWNSAWVCCLGGPAALGAHVEARHGTSGASLWRTDLTGLAHVSAVDVEPIGDVTGDGAPDLAVVSATDTCCPGSRLAAAFGLDGRTGAVLWDIQP